jgi:hypothetical protein
MPVKLGGLRCPAPQRSNLVGNQLYNILEATIWKLNNPCKTSELGKDPVWENCQKRSAPPKERG